jgi:hypothetical protein
MDDGACRFALRLVDLDVDFVKPCSELDELASPLTGRTMRQVPVVRVFGTTPRGQKACIHVHGAFRYFLVPSFLGETTDRTALRLLAEDLETELRRGREQPPGGAAHALVFDISVVHLTQFYGYHEEPRPFLRVAMVNDALHPACRRSPFRRITLPSLTLPSLIPSRAGHTEPCRRRCAPLQPWLCQPACTSAP